MRKKNRASFIMLSSLTIGIAIAGCSQESQPIKASQAPEKPGETVLNAASVSQQIPSQVELAACSAESMQQTTSVDPSVKKWSQLRDGRPLSGIASISVDPIFDGAGYGWKPGTSYAITKDGSVWKWGYDNRPMDFPVRVKGINGVKQITDSFALTNDGQVWKLDQEGTADKIKELKNVESLQLGEMFDALYVLRKDGTLWKLENDSDKPEQLTGIANMQKLYASAFSLYLIDQAGRLHYLSGREGPFKSENKQVIPLPGKVKQFAVSYQDHALIQVESGEVYAFSAKEQQPKHMPLADGAKRLAVNGDGMYLMVKTDGSVWGWGTNTNHMLGESQPKTVEKPVPIQTLNDIIDIQAGTDHALALDKNGQVYSWGSNMTGQLGRVPLFFAKWTELGQLSDIQQAVSKMEKPYFLRKDGSIWSMHENRTTYKIKGPAHIQKLDSMLGFPVTINQAGKVQLWQKNFSSCQTLTLPFSVKDMVAGDDHLLVRTIDDRFMAIAFDYTSTEPDSVQIVPGKVEMVKIDSTLAPQIKNLYANLYTFLALTKEGEVIYADRTKDVPYQFKRVQGLHNIIALAPEFFVRATHDPASVWSLDDKGRVQELLLQPEFERSRITSIQAEIGTNEEEGIDKISGRLRLTKDGQIFEHDWSPSIKERISEPVRLVSSTYRYWIEGPGSHYHLLVTESDKIIVIGFNPFGQSESVPEKVITP